MAANLPPGVSDSDIPGNRPEDIFFADCIEETLILKDEKPSQPLYRCAEKAIRGLTDTRCWTVQAIDMLVDEIIEVIEEEGLE